MNYTIGLRKNNGLKVFIFACLLGMTGCGASLVEAMHHEPRHPAAKLVRYGDTILIFGSRPLVMPIASDYTFRFSHNDDNFPFHMVAIVRSEELPKITILIKELAQLRGRNPVAIRATTDKRAGEWNCASEYEIFPPIWRAASRGGTNYPVILWKTPDSSPWTREWIRHFRDNDIPVKEEKEFFRDES